MKSPLRFSVPDELTLPPTPPGVDLEVGLALLRNTGAVIVEENEKEHSFKAQLGEAAVAIYTRGQRVSSAWYDDPLGRWSTQGKKRKIELHLARYAALPGWSVWNENDWMKYWKHEAVPIRMVYGIHMDVIRFNCHE